MKIDMSTLAEVDISEFDLSENSTLYDWLNNYATFKHTDAFEFVHHLFLDESENWFVLNKLPLPIPESLKEAILEARRNGAARICFYA